MFSDSFLRRAWISILFLQIPCLVIFIFNNLIAESLDLHGVQMQVDSFEEIDSNSIKLTLFGTSLVLAPQNLDEFILDSYLKEEDRIRIISNADWHKLVVNLNALAKYELAARALNGLLLHPGYNQKDQELLEELRALPGYINLFEQAFLNASQLWNRQALVFAMMLEVGLKDIAWFKGNILRYAFAYGVDFRAYLRARFNDYEVNQNNLEAGAIAAFCLAVYGASESSCAEMSSLSDAFRAVQGAFENQDLDRIGDLIVQVHDSIFQNRARAYQIQLIHMKAESAINNRDHQGALSLLALVDINKRTPSTHALVKRALDGLAANQLALTLEPRIALMLRAIAGKDPDIYLTYLKLLEQQIRYLAQIGDLPMVREVFDIITQLRPDPDLKNDYLRSDVILILIERGMVIEARDLLKEIKAGLPLFRKVKLVWKGAYFSRYIVVLLLLLLCVPPLWIYLLGPLQGAFTAKNSGHSSVAEEAPIKPAFVSRNQYNPQLDELRSLLKIFGLDETAKLKAIKTAYRNSVKNLHPDAHRDSSRERSERFIDLTQKYERILELKEKIK